MELIVKEYQLPEALEFNYQELKTELESRVNVYTTTVYTEDSIKEAKADRAQLNKLKKVLTEERIRRKKEYLAAFQDFENKISELAGIVDNASSCIDKQIKEFEDLKKAEKKETICKLFYETFSEDYPWLKIEQIWDDRWLNSTASLKTISTIIEGAITTIDNELHVLGRLKDYGFEAQEHYKKNLNLNEAIRYADELAQINEAKKRAESQQKPQEIAVETPKVECLPVAEENTEIERIWLNFSVHVSMEEAGKLAAFLKDTEIEYKRI